MEAVFHTQTNPGGLASMNAIVCQASVDQSARQT